MNTINPRWSFLDVSPDGTAAVDKIPVKEMAEKYGTPLYILVESEIRKRLRRFKEAFPYKKLQVQYAAKCNTSLEILNIVREEGFELDASSVGEILLGLIAGFKPSQITLTNLYKHEQDLEFMAKLGLKAITIDNIEEIGKIDAAGRQLGKKIQVFLRINPLIKLGRYSTLYHKYGVPYSGAKRAIDSIISRPNLELTGLHFHGSYISMPQVYTVVLAKLMQLAKYCKQKGVVIKYIDLGGGFPVEHDDKKCFQPEDMGKKLIQFLKQKCLKLGLEEPNLIFEPGKFITANAGIGLVKIVSVKPMSNKVVAITDGSTYGFVPDVLAYDWYYEILPATKMNHRPKETYNIAGCTCDAEDMIGSDRKLPMLQVDDLLMIMDCGAYSTVLASNFNTLKRAPVIMVKDGTSRLVRRRDKYSEIFSPELDALKLSERHQLKAYTNQIRPEERKPK